MIKALIFDCFGVLYKDPTLIFYEQYIPQYEHHRIELADLDKQYDYGYISSAEHAQQVALLSGLEADFIEQNLRKNNKRNDELIERVRMLGRDYKIGMLSNVGRGGIDLLFSEVEEEELFDEIVLSYEEGILKPDPEIFQRTAERLGCLPEECVMIDDRQENCTGAASAGLATILYQTNHQLNKDLERLLQERGI